MLAVASPNASAGAVLKLGDILVAEPGTSSISVVDSATGVKTVISQGGLLLPTSKTVGVALALDGDIIVAHRLTGLIRVNPVTGAQSVLSQGGLFRDPWAIAINRITGDIYVADSGYDNDRPHINEAGKIIRVNPASGAQELIASGNPCNFFPSNVACQNTTSAGAYLSHPYGIAIDYSVSPETIVVADMSSFSGKGAIIRIVPVPSGAQTLLWGPASALPSPQVPQLSPLGCPMGIAVEPTGNILVTAFTFPVPGAPIIPPPNGTFYGCSPPGIFRIDLLSNVQTVVNTSAPAWQSNHSYAVGDVVLDATSPTSHVHRVLTAGVSQGSTPVWNGTANGVTADGTVVWENIGLGANWLVPFGVEAEPAPTTSDPSHYTIIVGDEGHSMLFRLSADGAFIPTPGPLAVGLSSVTSLDVITFRPQGGFKTEPVRSNGQPTGKLATGTTQATLGLTTNMNATCRYSPSAGVPYESMPSGFSTTGGTAHASTVGGLTGGTNYNFYVRCADGAGHPNTSDLVISFSVSAPPPPIAAYDFDEGGGVSVADASGNGHTGLISGAIWSSEGKFGKALDFDGVDDWVTVNSTAALGLTTGMTLEAWVFPTALGTAWRNVLIKERASGEVYNLYAHTSDGVPVVYVVPVAPETPLDATGSVPLALNTWTHIAATYDNVTLRLYVNGSQVGSRAMSGALTVSGGALRIGGNSVWGEFFQGRIDEVRIYDRALSTEEILADMNTPVDATSPDRTTSNFLGTESPLSENGVWDSPGAWADLQKDNGAFAGGVNAQARLVTPTMAADQYSEITYSQDPGSSGWVGVTTRVQGPANGSGYLAIAYAGEVRLYRTDDAGALNFILLASSTVDISVAPRRLRLESQGDNHRVFFNGSLILAHQASGTTYSTGQPGIAASAFGGSPVKILSFESGDVGAVAPDTAMSTFSGVEDPLYENGVWDSPGAWGNLQKNGGAYAAGLNGQGRLVTPTLAQDQYSEITYSQDPGSSSWVGVTTRVQGPTNGSCYLAIVYAGEVRLYRTDDTGSLNFTLLASVGVGLGAAPRRLRLESEGNNHRVYLNATQVISHTASETVYSSGQPGIAASVFGGPQGKILSFQAGNVGVN